MSGMRTPDYLAQKTVPRKVLTTIMAIFLGVSLSLSVITLVLKQTVLNFDLNMQIISDQKIDQKIAVILPGVIFEQLTGNAAPAVSALLADPSTGIAVSLIPPDWVNFTLQQAVRSAIFTLESGSASFSFKIDLTPIKQQIANTSSSISARVIDQMPTCTADQLLSFAGSAISGTASNLPFCKPGEPFTQLVAPIVSNWIAGLGSQIPSSLDIPVVNMTAADQKTPIVRVVRLVQGIMPYRKASAAVSLILFLAILGINWKNLPHGLRWIGITFLISAACLLVTLGAAAEFSSSVKFISDGANPMMAELSQMGSSYLNALMLSIKGMMIKITALFVVCGVVLLLITRKDRFIWQDQSRR